MKNKTLMTNTINKILLIFLLLLITAWAGVLIITDKSEPEPVINVRQNHDHSVFEDYLKSREEKINYHDLLHFCEPDDMDKRKNLTENLIIKLREIGKEIIENDCRTYENVRHLNYRVVTKCERLRWTESLLEDELNRVKICIF